MQSIGKFSYFLEGIITRLGKLGGFFALLNAFFVTYEVIMRYIFGSPTIWVMEISIYVVIAASFLPLGYILVEKGHVKVDVVTSHLSRKAAVSLEIITSVLSLLFCLILDWEGARIAFTSFKSWELSPTLLGIPIFIPQSLIPIGSFFLTIQFIIHINNLFKDLHYSRPVNDKGSTAHLSPERLTVGQFLIPGIFLTLLIIGIILLKVNVYLGLTILFFLLLFSGMPVFGALGFFAVLGFYFLFGGAPRLIQVGIMAYSAVDSTVTVSLPLFVLAGTILKSGGMGGRIFKFANALVGHLPGGLGIAAVIFCCFFASMTGASVAVAATVSLIALPEMISRGYKRPLVIGLLAGGGTLGNLFPPSIPLMVYGAMTGESIGTLFLATLIPGVILATILSLYVFVVAGRNKNIERGSRASLKEIISAFKNAIGGLGTIVIIMGGIYSGIFTPVEAGAVATLYSIILCCFVYRTLTWEGLKNTIYETIKIFSMIMFVIIGANITGQVIVMAQIPNNILAFVKSMVIPPWMVILCINIFLIIMGGPLEAITILVISLPILYPLIIGLGFSGVWFGVIMMINMELALISPPEGLNIFVLQQIGKCTTSEVFKGVIPFCIILALFLALISFVPSLTTWLPNMLSK